MMSTRPHLRRKRPADLSSDDTNEIKPWRFLRVMPTSILQESMQRVPCEFSSKFSCKASISVSFSVPNYNSWIISVTKKMDKLELCAGWDKFVKDNSIHDGDIILFKYKGNCKFKVSIFDPAGCEILQSHNHFGKQKIGSSNEKRHEETSSTKFEREEEVDEEDNDRNPSHKMKPRTGQKSPPGLMKKENATGHGESSTKLKAFLLSLKNPFFLAKINHSRNELLVPSGVIKTFDIQFDETIILEDPKERKWEARVVTWKNGVTRVAGWSRFCTLNLVTDEDACVCEFIPGNGPTCQAMKVHILRDQKKAATLLGSCTQKL